MVNINDPSGVFTIEIFGRDLLDAGTKENLGMGAPFSMIGGTATDSVGGLVGPAGDLSEFLSTGTPAGMTITDFAGADELLATITVSTVPEPSSVLGLIVAGGLVGCLRRRHSIRCGK